ncbi:hypothetical protein E2C01_073057 [Portunus trituberculatus]|uniref:Uncharacterized protein n=1 Tax=Portunus trituberculatus TaxID=210409 RepID=A0A5B7ICC0_PORTR|nr:hypothetical protein [Portunus trituberculatus]
MGQQKRVQNSRGGDRTAELRYWNSKGGDRKIKEVTEQQGREQNSRGREQQGRGQNSRGREQKSRD